MAHSVQYQIKKANEVFLRQIPQFLGCNSVTKYAEPFRQFAIEQGISEADIDKHLNKCREGAERATKAEREGTGPGARLLRAMFTDPATLKPKRLLVIADDDQHLTNAKSALQALGYEVTGQLCDDLDRCASCGKPRADCLCAPADLQEYVHDAGLRP